MTARTCGLVGISTKRVCSHCLGDHVVGDADAAAGVLLFWLYRQVVDEAEGTDVATEVVDLQRLHAVIAMTSRREEDSYHAAKVTLVRRRILRNW